MKPTEKQLNEERVGWRQFYLNLSIEVCKTEHARNGWLAACQLQQEILHEKDKEELSQEDLKRTA